MTSPAVVQDKSLRIVETAAALEQAAANMRAVEIGALVVQGMGLLMDMTSAMEAIDPACMGMAKQKIAALATMAHNELKAMGDATAEAEAVAVKEYNKEEKVGLPTEPTIR